MRPQGQKKKYWQTDRSTYIQTDWQMVGLSLPENAYRPKSIAVSCLVMPCYLFTFSLFFLFIFLFSSLLFASLPLFYSLLLPSLLYYSLAGTGGIEPPTTLVVPPSGAPIFVFFFSFFFLYFIFFSFTISFLL